MKKKSKTLLIGLLVLGMALPLASCNVRAKRWEKVLDFFNKIDTSTSNWKGVSYTYTKSDKDDTDGKVVTEENKSSLYRIDSEGVITATASSGKYTKNSNTGVVTDTYTESYYDGSSDYRMTIEIYDDDEYYSDDTIYEIYDDPLAEGPEGISDEVNKAIEIAKDLTLDDLKSINVGSTAVRWKYSSGDTTYTYHLRVDTDNVISYFSEIVNEERDSGYMTETNLWQKVKGGTVSEPRWYRRNKDEFTTNESEPDSETEPGPEEDPNTDRDPS